MFNNVHLGLQFLIFLLLDTGLQLYIAWQKIKTVYNLLRWAIVITDVDYRVGVPVLYMIFLLPELIIYVMFSHKFSSLFFSFFHVFTYAVFMYVVFIFFFLYLMVNKVDYM